MKRPTMRDVARRVGVSRTTVSHVVNDTRFVADETRQRVQQAIAELGYHPSVAARSLTTQRTHTIGVLLSDVTNPFFAEVFRGIEDALMPEDYVIVCNTGESQELEAHYLRLLVGQLAREIGQTATNPLLALIRGQTFEEPDVVLDCELVIRGSS